MKRIYSILILILGTLTNINAQYKEIRLSFEYMSNLTFSDVMNDINSLTSVDLIIDDTLSINSYTKFPEYVNLRVVYGAVITINDTLKVMGDVNLPSTKCFEYNSNTCDLIVNSRNIEDIKPIWFGADGIQDGGTSNRFYNDPSNDDTIPLQNAVNCSRSSKKPLELGNYRYYITTTLQCDDVEINGIGKPKFTDFRRSDGSSARNATLQGDYSTYGYYEVVLNSEGSIITSNIANPIIESKNFKFKGFGIIGTVRDSDVLNQIGLTTNYVQDFTPYSEDDIETHFTLEDFGAYFMSGTGIILMKGAESSKFYNVDCSFNKKHGLWISHADGVDSPQEYLDFKNCSFRFNKDAGLYLDQFRKRLTIDNCRFDHAGQYEIYSAPTNPLDVIPGILIETAPSNQSNPSENLPPHTNDIVIENSYAEYINSLILIDSKNVFFGLTIQNNHVMRGGINNRESHLVTLDGNWVSSLDFYNNEMFDGPNTWNEYYDGTTTLKDVDIKNIRGDEPVKSLNCFDYIDATSSNQQVWNTDVIKKSYSSDIPDNAHGTVSTVWIVSGTWNANNETRTESYLVVATKLPNNTFQANTSFLGTSGTYNQGCMYAPPSINTNGTLSVYLDPYCLSSVQRIDLLGNGLKNNYRLK